MDEWAVDLPGSPTSVRLARQWVREILQKDFRELVEDVALIASELVTNSVRHSAAAEGAPIKVRIRVVDGILRLEVEDSGAPGQPNWAKEQATDFGRGLGIVAAVGDVMGDETTTSGGRLAWAELKV